MARNSWSQLWESTEGPTVTLTLPRDLASQLLDALASALEMDGADGDMPFDMGGDDSDDGIDLGGDDTPLEFGADSAGDDDIDLDMDSPAGDDSDEEDGGGRPKAKSGKKPEKKDGKKKEKKEESRKLTAFISPRHR